MDFITLDFETAYRSKKDVGTIGAAYSLKTMTYEEYIYDERFKIHGVGIKINNADTQWHYGDVETILRDTFQNRSCALICHNTLFDGAILSWLYGITCDRYYCTQAMSRALWAQSSASLDALAKRLWPDDHTKRKGDELKEVDGLWELTPELNDSTGRYCIQDVDLTFDAFGTMWQFFPDSELDVMSLTLKMFIEPKLTLNEGQVITYQAQLDAQRADAINEVIEKEGMANVIAEATKEAIEFSHLPELAAYKKADVLDESLRAWKHANRYQIRKARKKDTAAILDLMDILDSELEGRPLPFCFMAARLTVALKNEKENLESATAKILGSGDMFSQYIKYKYGIEAARKHQPTPKNKHNTTWALAKDDLEFLELQKQRPDLLYLWNARKIASSSLERTRAERLKVHARLNGGLIAAPLNYCAAHTKRWGGTNKVNFQNFGRNSPLRRALEAPEGYQVVVADLSNIESRVLAWFAGCTELLWAYKNGRDIYSEFASDVFDRPVNRKLKATNETGDYIDEQGNVVEEDDAYKPDEIAGFVGKVCILGLGYGMGAATLQNTFAKGALGGPQMFFDFPFCERIVKEKYRGRYKEIKACWDKADQVIYDMACPQLEPYQWGCLTVEYQRLRLPNGLYLTYPNLIQVEHPEQRGMQFEYWNGEFHKNLYGGLLIENIIQALSRIIMADAMVRIEDRFARLGLGNIVLTVHDEIIAVSPTPDAQRALDLMIEDMCIPPDWCNDGTLKLDAEGGYSHCYSK